MDGFTSTHKPMFRSKRREDKWIDSQALPNPSSKEKERRQMDGFRSSLNPMFIRGGEEINGWIQKHSTVNSCSGEKERR